MGPTLEGPPRHGGPVPLASAGGLFYTANVGEGGPIVTYTPGAEVTVSYTGGKRIRVRGSLPGR